MTRRAGTSRPTLALEKLQRALPLMRGTARCPYRAAPGTGTSALQAQKKAATRKWLRESAYPRMSSEEDGRFEPSLGRAAPLELAAISRILGSEEIASKMISTFNS